jgi:RNA polymerase sigma-70 factor (ECF subfamily)
MNVDRCGGGPFTRGDDEPPESSAGPPPDDPWRSDVEALYRRRADHLIRLLTPAVAGRDAATDVVHEAFARFAALSRARRLIVARPDAYVYRMCLNLARDLSRRHHSRAIPAGAEPFGEADRNDPAVQLEQRDELRRLEAALQRLKPKTREIFLAKRLDGMTYAQIADRTGLSVRGVEKHMTKAIAALDRARDRGRP